MLNGGSLLLAMGLVLVVEGLVVVLAPSRLEDLLAMLARLSVERRRFAGLAALAAGVGLIWLARIAGA